MAAAPRTTSTMSAAMGPALRATPAAICLLPNGSRCRSTWAIWWPAATPRVGRLQQHEGRQGRSDHRDDRRRAGDKRECHAGHQRCRDPRRSGGHRSVPGLQPGHRPVRRPLSRQWDGLHFLRLLSQPFPHLQLHEGPGLGGGSAPGHGLHHCAPQLHVEHRRDQLICDEAGDGDADRDVHDLGSPGHAQRRRWLRR